MPTIRYRYRTAVAAYEQSDRFVVDAIDHLADHRGDLPDSLVAAACDLYRDSVEFDTVIEDLCDGETTL